MDALQTLAFAGLALGAGEALRRWVPVLARLNLPAAVLGGLAVAVAVLFLPRFGLTAPAFDTTLQKPLLVAFFATLGFSASLPLLRAGGRQVFLFLGLAALLAFGQGILGIGIASAFGLPPLFGVLTGTATLAGGPATALAFAPAFEQAGIAGAGAIGIVAAMGGIVLGGLVGGPLAGRLVSGRGWLGNRARPGPGAVPLAAVPGVDADAPARAGDALPAANLVLLVMWVGGFIGEAITAAGLTLPAYVGAMVAAAVVRNLAEVAGKRLPLAALDTLGSVVLPLFMAMALMTLDLRQLAGLATPLAVNLVAQVALVVAVAYWVVPRVMGRDYDAVVMSGGYTGFMLGTTANAMAVMGTLVNRYGPAPRAYLVAPLVGAFFIDFTNALLLTLFLDGFAPG